MQNSNHHIKQVQLQPHPRKENPSSGLAILVYMPTLAVFVDDLKTASIGTY